MRARRLPVAEGSARTLSSGAGLATTTVTHEQAAPETSHTTPPIELGLHRDRTAPKAKQAEKATQMGAGCRSHASIGPRAWH